MDAMLANPNLTPIGYTNKPFDSQQQQPVDMMGAQPGAVPGALVCRLELQVCHQKVYWAISKEWSAHQKCHKKA
jgi:hypothetical protein